MIQDQSESNSERGKDKNFYLSEEAGLTPLLAMAQSFEECDWLVVQGGNKRALLRVGFIIRLHFEITGVIFHVLPYSLSLSLTHTHTHIINVYLFFIYHTVILTVFHRTLTATQYGSERAVRYRNHRSCMVVFFPVAKYVKVGITFYIWRYGISTWCRRC